MRKAFDSLIQLPKENEVKDYLNVIVTAPDGEKEWQAQGIAVPRVGDDVVVRDDRGEVYFEGTVKNVCWTYRKGGPGAVVSVWLGSTKDHP